MIMSALSPSTTTASRVKQQQGVARVTTTSSQVSPFEGGVSIGGAENLNNSSNNHHQYYNHHHHQQQQQQQPLNFQDSINNTPTTTTTSNNTNSYNHHHHFHQQHQQQQQASMDPNNIYIQHVANQQHNKLAVDYDDNNMDANNIDENMTVPHPSVQSTIASGNSAAFTGSHQQAYHHQQQHNNFDSYYNQQATSMDSQHQLQHHHLQQQQQQQQQDVHNHQQQHHHQNHHHQQQPQLNQHLQQQHQQQHDEITNSLSILIKETLSVDQQIQGERDLYQEFVLKITVRGKLLHNLRQAEALAQQENIEKCRRDLHNFETSMRVHASNLNNLRLKTLQRQMDIFERLSIIQAKVLYEYLPKWHRDQQYSNNGVKLDCYITLDLIQSWIEKLIDISWRLRNQNRGAKLTASTKPNIPFPFEKLEQFGLLITRSLETLILSAFVVEKQPPQVMKTNTRFTSTVRFLVGSRLNIQLINPNVKAIILSESNARAIIQRHKDMIESSWASLSDYQLDQQQQASSTTSGVISPPLNYSPAQQQQQFIQQQQQQQFANQQSANSNNNSPASQQQAMTLGHTNQLAAHQQSLSSTTSSAVSSPASSSASTIYQQASQQPFDCQSKFLDISQFDPSGEIVNNSNPLEYQDPNAQLTAQFRNMQLRKIKRTEKKGTESVMDEKFVLLFVTEFRIADSTPLETGRPDLCFQLMAFSLPAVVIVHGNQEPYAWATVTWHNAFATPDELLYRVPDRVPWRELGAVLSEKFKSFSGKGLNKHNLDYLATKVVRSHNSGDDMMVSWAQFAKEPLSDKSFTFWEWFHSIQKLTKEHLRDLWNANRIYGFIGKKGCTDLLLGPNSQSSLPIGTFLLRFSETELGGVTIAWVSPPTTAQSITTTTTAATSTSSTTQNKLAESNSQRLSPTGPQQNVLMHLQPFTSKDLNTRSLADRIRDLKDLVYLYPDIPKDEAFKSYYTPLNETSHMTNGYIRPMLIQTLATNYPKDVAASVVSSNEVGGGYATGGNGGGGSSGVGGGLSQTNSMDCAATPSPPNSFSQSSPDGIYHDNAMLNTMDANYPPSYEY